MTIRTERRDLNKKRPYRILAISSKNKDQITGFRGNIVFPKGVSDICGRIVNEHKNEAMYEYAGIWW
jgi:hypothetical protein